MYVKLLSAALAGQEEEPDQAALLLAVLLCRARLFGSTHGQGGPAYDALANEVAYDRSLFNLSAAKGIEVDPARFHHPKEERARLERGLTSLGVELGSYGGGAL